MKTKNLCNLVMLLVLIFSSAISVYPQLQKFTLQEREYRFENGKWFTFFEGRLGDEIIHQRLVARLNDKGYIENFDFQRFNIEGISLASPRFLDGFYVLGINPDHNPFEIASSLEKTGLFEILEFDAIGERHGIPNDPNFNQQWNLPKIRMPQGWDITIGNSSIILSIIDSGILYTHEDLDGNIWVNPAEDRNGNGRPDFYSYNQGGDLDGIDNDGKGYVDDLLGWDFAGGGNNPQPPYSPDNNPLDTYGHGTNVAGVSSAQTNNYENGSYRGIAGVAGGWGIQKGASLMVLRDGGYDPIYSLTAAAIEYAANNGARVINISSGFTTNYTVLAAAVNYAANARDVIIVASTGNFLPGTSDIRYPAKYSNTIAVGATDENDSRRSYSCFGPEIDVVAPDGVPSTTMAGGYTSSVTGTSFSAPHVAGLAALLRSKVPSLKLWEVRDIIKNSADKVSGMGGNNFTNSYGYGRINAYKALSHPVISNFTQSPNPLYVGGNGTVTAHLSQGNGNLTFNWTAEDFPAGATVAFSGNQAFITFNTTSRQISSFGNSFLEDANSHNEARFPQLTLTVSNSAGSHTRSTTVYLLSQPPPYGCPFVYTWNGEIWVAENNILPQSQDPNNIGQDVTDYYQLYTKPKLDDDKYYLAVAEFANDKSYLDQLQLLVIDHPLETMITVNDDGEIIQFAKPAFVADAMLDSANVLKQIYQLDSLKTGVSEGDTLTLSFEGTSVGAEKWLLLVANASNIAKALKAGDVLNENKESFSSFRLRSNPIYQWVLVPDGNTSSLQVDIAFKSEAEVDYTELSHKLELPFTVFNPQLTKAEHSIVGDITSLVTDIDQNYAELNKDEWIQLEFSAPPINESLKRSFVFVSSGRYVKLDKQLLAKGKSENLLHTKQDEKIVYEYGLSQNHPNPFNPITTISYQLRESGLVQLRVYDMLGREIALLVNEERVSGKHNITFDASDLPSGVYIYSLRVNYGSGSFVQHRKMTVLK